MLVLSNPLCCDKVYESVFCTPTRTSLVLLNRKGAMSQNGKIFQRIDKFLIIQFDNIVTPQTHSM